MITIAAMRAPVWCLLLFPSIALAQGEKPKAEVETHRLSYIFSKLEGKTATYRIQNTLTQSKRVVGKSGKTAPRIPRPSAMIPRDNHKKRTGFITLLYRTPRIPQDDGERNQSSKIDESDFSKRRRLVDIEAKTRSC